MEKNALKESFANRLKTVLIDAGLRSSRSEIGVQFNKLAEIAGCSKQMARRYVIADAIPEPQTLLKIAQYFEVSPGWLLFGDTVRTEKKTLKTLTLETDLIKYLFNKIIPISSHFKSTPELVDFLIEMLFDINNIHADKKSIYKIIDMMIGSIEKIGEPNKLLHSA